MLVQAVEDPPDAAVHREQHAVVDASILIYHGRKFFLIGIEGVHRRMHRVVGQVQEEGLVMGAIDEGAGFRTPQVRQVFGSRKLFAVAKNGGALPECRVAAANGNRFIEAAFARPRRLVLRPLVPAEVPLPDVCRSITGILKYRGQQGLVKEQPGPVFAVDVAVYAEALLVLAGQQAHPRSHADRGGDIGIGEQSAFFREAIDIRGGDF